VAEGPPSSSVRPAGRRAARPLGPRPESRPAAPRPANQRPGPPPALDFRSTAAEDGATVAAALRARLPEQSWSAVRRLCQSGKITVNGACVLDPAHRLGAGSHVTLQINRPRPRPEIPGFAIAYEDPHLVVIEKPAGVSSVPFAEKETGTAMDLLRTAWRADGRQATKQPLYVVHRLDKETSGLLCFAKTKLAERGLHHIFQNHLATRTYLALAEGEVAPGRIDSHLVADRGDGLRGSARPDHRGRSPAGRRSVTHVEVIERLPGATLCRVRLETGRTHQIRIHLSERGHPLVGDRVYDRDRRRAGAPGIDADRLMLHAERLGFLHPVGATPLDFTTAPPPAFTAVLERLRGRGARPTSTPTPAR